MELKKGIFFDYLKQKYYIHDIVANEGTDYIVAINYKNPREVEVFAYKFEGEKFMVKYIEDNQIIKSILFSSLKNAVA